MYALQRQLYLCSHNNRIGQCCRNEVHFAATNLPSAFAARSISSGKRALEAQRNLGEIKLSLTLQVRFSFCKFVTSIAADKTRSSFSRRKVDYVAAKQSRVFASAKKIQLSLHSVCLHEQIRVWMDVDKPLPDWFYYCKKYSFFPPPRKESCPWEVHMWSCKMCLQRQTETLNLWWMSV